MIMMIIISHQQQTNEHNQEPISAFQLERIQKKELVKLQFSNRSSNHIGSVSSSKSVSSGYKIYIFIVQAI